MRRLGLTLLVLVLTTWSARAERILTEGKPADVGMSADVLKEGVALFSKATANDDIRGAVLLVACQGKVVLHEAVGWKDKDGQLPLRKETLFHVASNTKAVVAAAALMLVDEDKLRLDEAVYHYLPSFDNEKSRAITVRQLLTHTSGFRVAGIFPSPLLKKSLEHPNAPSLRAEVDRLGAIGPEKTPGSTYSYNNANYNTLGALVEVISKEPLEGFLTSHIYRPLGMTDACHHDAGEFVERRSCIYRKKDNKWQVTYRPGDAPKIPFVRGSGGLVVTAADYARFLQMFLNGGSYDGRRFLKPETVALATTPQIRSLYSPEEQKKRTSFYGFGWHVADDGSYHHGGSDGTYVWVDPKQEIIGLVFTQSPGGRIPVTEFVKLVGQACQPFPKR